MKNLWNNKNEKVTGMECQEWQEWDICGMIRMEYLWQEWKIYGMTRMKNLWPNGKNEKFVEWQEWKIGGMARMKYLWMAKTKYLWNAKYCKEWNICRVIRMKYYGIPRMKYLSNDKNENLWNGKNETLWNNERILYIINTTSHTNMKNQWWNHEIMKLNNTQKKQTQIYGITVAIIHIIALQPFSCFFK